MHNWPSLLSGEVFMAKVIGVGGVFFQSPDPEGLMAWY